MATIKKEEKQEKEEGKERNTEVHGSCFETLQFQGQLTLQASISPTAQAPSSFLSSACFHQSHFSSATSQGWLPKWLLLLLPALQSHTWSTSEDPCHLQSLVPRLFKVHLGHCPSDMQ